MSCIPARHIQPKLLVKVYDGKDEVSNNTKKGSFTRKVTEGDSVQKILKSLQSGWDESIMIRTKLEAKVKRLEYENSELKKQLEAALIEIDFQKKRGTVDKEQEGSELGSDDEEGYYGGERVGKERLKPVFQI